MEKNATTEDMKTLVSAINSLIIKGFDENFKIENSKLVSLKTNKTYEPQDIHIVDFFRFEGASDPADNSILYAIETDDGIKGIITDAYGPYSDSLVTQFIKEVEDISKKTTANVNSKN